MTGAVERRTFFWQGLLIVLPALLLAAFGLLSLRQDRILARHEAAQQAAQIAERLARVRLPSALAFDPGPATGLTDPLSVLRKPEFDPVLVAARAKAPWVACLITGQVDLAYPPPARLWAPPAALEPETLSQEQRRGWDAAEALAVGLSDLPAAVAAWERFLASSPPTAFAGFAQYRLGALFQKQGSVELARRQYERVLRDFSEATAESGVPLRFYARLALLRLAPPASEPSAALNELIEALGAEALLSYPSLTEPLLARIEELPGPMRSMASRWRAVAEAHARARRLHHQYRLALAGRQGPDQSLMVTQWLDQAPGQPWLALPREVGGRRWLLGLAERDLRQGFEQVLREESLPAHLGGRVEVAGRVVAGERRSAAVLAASEGSLAPGQPAPDLKVSVLLTDPDRLDARQRARTRWLGALIAAATLAVILGFVAAWRAFREQQQLSEMKSNFVSSVSHELRAPIASVRLMAEELADQEDPARRKHYLRFMVQECSRLSGLIENVLNFARHEQGRQRYEFEPADLVALVQETVTLMRIYGGDKRVELATVSQGAPVELEVDGRAIQQVLVNLIDNAIKHSPAGATVTVGLDFAPSSAENARPESAGIPRPRRELGWGKRRTASHDRVIHLWVEDHGEGIPRAEQDRIFERFYRRGSEQRRATQGVGLGLAIVKLVTAAHGGRVIVQSEVGHGSRFTVELPIRHDS